MGERQMPAWRYTLKQLGKARCPVLLQFMLILIKSRLVDRAHYGRVSKQ